MDILTVYKLLCVLIGYGSGCILSAQIVAKTIYHTSLFEEGSGNPGMANAGRVLGTKAAVLTLCGDILKTALAIGICWVIFPDLRNICILYCGFGVVVGHDFPFWNHFHGGKGVASYITTIILYSPIFGIVCSLIGLAFVAMKKGLKIPVAVISILYTGCMMYTGSMQAIFLSFLLMLLMIERNMRKTRLDLEEEEKEPSGSEHSD